MALFAFLLAWFALGFLAAVLLVRYEDPDYPPDGALCVFFVVGGPLTLFSILVVLLIMQLSWGSYSSAISKFFARFQR